MNKNNLAIVIGGTGAIGTAIASEIENLGFQDVIKIGTKTIPSIDFNDEDTILNTVNFVKEKQKPISFTPYPIYSPIRKQRNKQTNDNATTNPFTHFTGGRAAQELPRSERRVPDLGQATGVRGGKLRDHRQEDGCHVDPRQSVAGQWLLGHRSTLPLRV